MKQIIFFKSKSENLSHDISSCLSKSEVAKVLSLSQIKPTPFLFSRMVFTFLVHWKRSKEEWCFMTCENYMIIKSRYPWLKLNWNTAMVILYLLSITAFALQWLSWVVGTKTAWPPKPKIFSIWLFTEKVCFLCKPLI